jgi:hypothetical protein
LADVSHCLSPTIEGKHFYGLDKNGQPNIGTKQGYCTPAHKKGGNPDCTSALGERYALPGGGFGAKDLRHHYQWKYHEEINGFYHLMDLGSLGMGKTCQQCFWRSLKAADWIDSETKDLQIEFVTHNPSIAGLFTLCSITFKFEVGGYMEVQQKVSSATIRPMYATSSDHRRFFSELVFLVILIAYLVETSMALAKLGLRKFSRDPERVLDTVSMICFMFNIYQWIAKLYDNKRLLGLVAKLVALDYKNLEAYQYQAVFIRQIAAAVETQKFISMSVSINIFLSILKIFIKLRFHRRMSIIGDVIVYSAKELVHFFLLLLMVCCFYAFMGMNLFGSQLKHFRTFGEAIQWMMMTMMMMTDPNDLEAVANPSFSRLFYWSYVGIVSVMMMNILLAIVVDAFESIRCEESAETFYESLCTDTGITCTKFVHCFEALTSKHSSAVVKRKTLRVRAVQEHDVSARTVVGARVGIVKRGKAELDDSSASIRANDLDHALTGIVGSQDSAGGSASTRPVPSGAWALDLASMWSSSSPIDRFSDYDSDCEDEPLQMVSIMDIASRLRKVGVGAHRRRVMILGLLRAQVDRDCKNQHGTLPSAGGSAEDSIVSLSKQLTALQLATSKMLVGQMELTGEVGALERLRADVEVLKRASSGVFADVELEVLGGMVKDRNGYQGTESKKREEESAPAYASRHQDWEL